MKPPSPIGSEDDIEYIKHLFDDLLDDMIDIGISRDDYTISIDLEKNKIEIVGDIRFKDWNSDIGKERFDKLISSECLKKFKENINKQYEYQDMLDMYAKMSGGNDLGDLAKQQMDRMFASYYFSIKIKK